MPFDAIGRRLRDDIGQTYENENIATDDEPRRFETENVFLVDVVIQVDHYGQKFGTASNQRFLIAAGGSYGCTTLNLSSLWFKNETAGKNGTVRILGVKL